MYSLIFYIKNIIFAFVRERETVKNNIKCCRTQIFPCYRESYKAYAGSVRVGPYYVIQFQGCITIKTLFSHYDVRSAAQLIITVSGIYFGHVLAYSMAVDLH